MTTHEPDIRLRLRHTQQHAAEFPEPDDNAIQISHLLYERILQRIRKTGGKLPFWAYMEMALHEPGLGYYSAGSHKLGKEGDFITAPEIAPLFSRTLARAITPALNRLPQRRILEIGAGSGMMAAEILAQLAEDDALPESYEILELSADLRERQQQTIQSRVPDLFSRVRWLDQLPDNIEAVVLANELLDAMPAHRFCIQQGQVQELYVCENQGRLDWHSDSPSTPRLAERVAAIQASTGQDLAEGYVSEILFAAEDWLRSLATHLQTGLVLLIDYGQTRRSYYHPQRDRGTLMCHYRHRAHDDPFLYPGLQDITVHVDFTAIADAALDAGLAVMGYTTQAHFLLGSGLTELVQTTDDPALQLEQANEIKKLTLPQEMGETFKVMGLTKNITLELPGFRMNDMRDKL